MKKCFLKAGFPAHASADTQDVTVENLQAISDLCKQGNLPDKAEDVVNFDNELATTENIQSAADIAVENSSCEVMKEMDDEGNERELKIRTFGALSVVSDLQEFAASKNVLELLVDAGCKGDHTTFSCEEVATMHFERHVGTEKLQLLYVS